MVKPSRIQSNAVLVQLRRREQWNKIQATVTKMTNTKAISNEKIKQNRQRYPNGNSFSEVKYFKEFTDIMDRFLVASVDENRQIVFKTSLRKMVIAREMCTPGSMLANEYSMGKSSVLRNSQR